MAHDEVHLKQVLIHLGNVLMWDGAAALTCMPIVTNERSVTALENGLVCKYILDNWDDIVKKSFEHFKKCQKKKDNK
jgi:hypothetical protein